MPRVARKAPGGLVYHVLNRAHGRLRLFKKEQDYTAFFPPPIVTRRSDTIEELRKDVSELIGIAREEGRAK